MFKSEVSERNGSAVVDVILGSGRTWLNSAVPFLEAQTDGQLEISVAPGTNCIWLPQSSGVWKHVDVPENRTVKIIIETKNPKPVTCPEEWIGNSTVPLLRTSDGYLQLKKESSTYYQIVAQMALSGQSLAYLVAHMPKIDSVHTHWTEHMHVELFVFNSELQEQYRGWLQVLLHRWNNICLVPFAAHWKRHILPTKVQTLCRLEDMDDEEYDGLRFRHGDLFKQAASFHNEADLEISDKYGIFYAAL